jgi:hypothetical protein
MEQAETVFSNASRVCASATSGMPRARVMASTSCASTRGRGYPVYFGREGDAVVILLCGGDKGSQARDIERAQDYWRDHRSRYDE